MPSISEILANKDFGQVVSTLCVDTIEYREPREYYREYHGERRRRKTSVGWREPKRLEVYSDTLVDKNGEPVRLPDKIVDVARIVTNFPKKEVRTPVSPHCDENQFIMYTMDKLILFFIADNLRVSLL